MYQSNFSFWILVIFFALVSAFGAAKIAESKGRDPGAWFFAGLFLGLLALLIVGLMAPASNSVTMAHEKPLFAESQTTVTQSYLQTGSKRWSLNNLQPFKVERRANGLSRIQLLDLSGQCLHVLESDNIDRLDRLAAAVNLAKSGGYSPQSDMAPSGSAATALSELRKMLQDGLITHEEHDKKKAEVLARL